MIVPFRRLRLAWWALILRARLRRNGIRLRLSVGPNLRVAGRPRLEVNFAGDGEGGSVVIELGRDVRIGRDLVLDVQPGGEHRVEVGDGTVFQDHVRLQLRGGAIRIADHASLRDGCELKCSGELTIGSRGIVGPVNCLHCEQRIVLGDRVGLAERVTVVDSDHVADGSDTWFMDRPLLVEPVVIEENVFVAANAVVLRGAEIGRNSVVAAGSVVLGGRYEANRLIGGVPAQTLKALDPRE